MQITHLAGRHLATDLDQMHAAIFQKTCYRVVVSRADSLALVLSRPRPEDTLYMHDDRVIVTVGPDVAPRVRDQTLDVEFGEDGSSTLILIPSPQPEGTNGRPPAP